MILLIIIGLVFNNQLKLAQLLQLYEKIGMDNSPNFFENSPTMKQTIYLPSSHLFSYWSSYIWPTSYRVKGYQGETRH
jgi:hypothetical protein